MKFIGIGDNVVDRYINKRIMFPGGNAVNFSVFVSELGKDSSFMGVIAGDDEGKLISDSLTEVGVDISHCDFREDKGTERCDVELWNGDRVFVGCSTGGREHIPLTLNEARLEILHEYDLIHCGCYSDMEDEIAKLRDHNSILTFDFSVEDEYRADEYLAKICPYIDLALFSQPNNAASEMEELRDRCFALGTPMVLMTMGKEGQILYVGEQEYKGTVKEVVPVDTMGAGDSFFACFTVTLADSGWKKETLPTPQAIEKAFEAAADFSAKNCLREGAFGFAMKY